MIKRFYFLLTGLLLTLASGMYAAIEPVNHRVQGTDLYNLNTSGTHELADNKFWMVDGGVANFDIQSVKNKIIFGIDESDLVYHASEYSYRITFDVAYKELVNGVLENKSFTGIVLHVNYDPARGTTYQDRGVFAFTGGLEVVISNVLIEFETTIGANDWDEIDTPTELYSSVFLETEISTERYYDFDPNDIPSTSINVSIVDGEAVVTWPFMEGAEEYDLEWAWVSRYDVDGTGALQLLGAGSVSFDFNLNASRVRLHGQNTYNIPLIYGDGYIVLRYRAVGRSGANYTVPIEGNWSTAGTVPGGTGLVSSAPNYFSVTAHENNGINYGAGMSFIENGVRSVGVTYMDGVLKPRQSQARLNSQDKIIVGSTIYDHYGRPGIGVMSTPVDQSTLGYVEDLNMYNDGVNPAVPYEKQHFDLDQTLVCGSMDPAPPMDPVNSNGAANYYSPENTDKEGYNAYLPDAQGYPFVQVQYTPDPTGRIRKVGGVGADHQLGDTDDGSAHYTEYFYTVPDDDELWALFGNDAARPENYTKVITKDVHGQISVALIDGMGRTVATYMEGTAPTGLDAIEGNTGMTPTGKDFMPYNQNFDPGVLQVQTPIVVTDPSVVYTFNYDFTGTTFNECLPANICYDCVYELEIVIVPASETACDITDGDPVSPTTISDADGVVRMTYTVGSITTFDTDCDTPLEFSTEFPGDEQFTVQFGGTGEYYIIKTLKVSEAPIAYYWEQYIEQDTCMLDYEDFLANSLAQVDWTQCDEYEPCEFNFLLEYGTVTVWLANNPTMDSTDYDSLKTEYLADCGTVNTCDIILPLLILDMSPGGQYGSTTTSDNLSVYNTGGNALGGDWLDVVFHNEDGSISYVDSDNDLVEDDLVTTLSIAEFFNHWQDSWAMDLIPFHPEYCYYDFCQQYPEIADYQQDMFDLETFDEACSSGYINPAEAAGYFDLAACTTNVEDPILGTLYDNLSAGDKTAINTIMNATYGSYSIYEMAVVMSGDDPGTVSFGSGCNEDKHWENFRILYMSKRFQVIEIIKADYVADNCIYAACVGSSEPACSTSAFNTSSKRYFNFESTMGYDLSELGNTDWEAAGDTAALDIDTLCFNMCEAQAATWMQQLIGCDTLLAGSETWASGQATYDSVYFYLVEVCAGGCAGGCFTLTQENLNVTTDTANHVFASFEDVIIYWLGEETLECNNLLITNPLPGACDGTIENYLDECACELLLNTGSDVADFVALYGYEPQNYDEEYCQCDAFDSNNDLDISGAEITALNAAEILTPTQYLCPVSCIDCAAMDNHKTHFYTDYGVYYYENTTLFTTYVNDLAGTDFTYQQLLGLIDNCIAVNTSATTPIYNMIDQKAYDIRALLEKLHQDDITTSGTYSHTQLPEYFYSGLYSCTDQATASYSYSPSIASDVLSFTTMGVGCTGTCSLSVDIMGTLPGAFATATAYFQNIISFDQVFITQGDILGTSTENIFHISVTVNDLSGGTITGDLKITSCYDIIEYIEDPITRELTFNLCPEIPVEEGNPCMENLIALAELDAQAQYAAYLEGQYDLFVAAYKEKCTQITDETFYMDYEANRYHYTLLWYDQSGNLVKTVSPKGVNPLTGTPLANAIAFADGTGTAVYPTHSYETIYKHNSLNQVVEVTTPDGGTSEYWYDHIGRLVVSQNAKQEDFQKGIMTGAYGTGTAVPAYSYTRYDALGRVYEVGEIIHPTAMTNTISKDPAALLAWLEEDVVVTEDVVRNNITLIYYDDAYNQTAANEFKISNGDDLYNLPGYGHTRNRITATAVIEDYVEHTSGTWIYPTPDYINHYRYDIHGNVQSYLQEITELGLLSGAEAQYRRTDYEYDLISGNPNYIYYQKGKPDQFIHHYKYDFDNRLKEVWTSNDGQVWDRDVNYEYREDGYLARTELGEMKVQGMDYAYTLHGWIKTLNSGVLNPDYDMGKDGDMANNAQYDAYESNIHDLHARDVLSYTVGYYNGDYLQISSGTGYNNMMVSMTGNIASDIDELFNGNITSYISGTTDTDGNKLNPLAISYHYDQLHRFKESHVFTYTDIISSNSTLNAVRANTTGPGGLGDYEMHVDYDMNGNILGLNRQAYSATNDMDEFTYNYISNTNKLDYVTDAETGTGSSGYGDIQHGQTTGNYLYHDDGSLKKDLDEEIEYIDWYPNGLVKRIYRTSTSTLSDLYFEYDPTGNRVLKVEMTRTSTTINPEEDWIYTYYATDANGITMAVYDLNPDDTDPDVLTKNEQMIYGGSRLGMETTPTVVSTAVDVINDCNNDGLASGVLEFTPGAISNGVVVEIMLDNIVIGDITYNTSNSLLVNLETLKDEINAQAEGYYVELIDESFLVYLRLKETVAGSLQSRELIVELDNTSTPSYVEREITIGNCAENRTLGKKFYELSNYLGNVMEVISDRKIAHNNAGTVDYFEADVVSYSDYYPFGMEMPGRNGSLGEYRYAYNGMEVDKEVSGNGNSYTTQFRQYDPRLGRWKSLDPVTQYWQTPYSSMDNNPIIYIDPLGDKIRGSIRGLIGYAKYKISLLRREAELKRKILTYETMGIDGKALDYDRVLLQEVQAQKANLQTMKNSKVRFYFEPWKQNAEDWYDPETNTMDKNNSPEKAQVLVDQKRNIRKGRLVIQFEQGNSDAGIAYGSEISNSFLKGEYSFAYNPDSRYASDPGNLTDRTDITAAYRRQTIWMLKSDSGLDDYNKLNGTYDALVNSGVSDGTLPAQNRDLDSRFNPASDADAKASVSANEKYFSTWRDYMNSTESEISASCGKGENVAGKLGEIFYDPKASKGNYSNPGQRRFKKQHRARYD